MENSNEVASRPRQLPEWEHELRPLDDLIEYFREYARERPEVVALTCFGIGFILGWKLKPW
jgi:hypothetical protein